MNDIQLIIFDLDGTLYDLNDVVTMNYRMQVGFYSSYTGMSSVETIKTFEQNDIYPVMGEKSKSATEFFIKSGIPASEWNDYREKHFDVKAICSDSAVNAQVIKEFGLNKTLILLSSNSINNIKKILMHINIPNTLFKEICCSDNCYGLNGFRKIDEIRLISKRYQVRQDKMLSIGDRYKTDVDP